MAEELAQTTIDERQNLIKYARHAAIAADQICASLLTLSTRLEELNIIPKDRKTKQKRDSHLKKNKKEVDVPDEKIEEMIQKLQGQPDAEAIIASLFRDLKVSRVKKIMNKLANNGKDVKHENHEDENEDA